MLALKDEKGYRDFDNKTSDFLHLGKVCCAVFTMGPAHTYCTLTMYLEGTNELLLPLRNSSETPSLYLLFYISSKTFCEPKH